MGLRERRSRSGDERFSVSVCRRVKQLGGIVHTFAVGQVFEQENVDWLKEIAADGHAIGNHTHDHVNVLATSGDDLQYRFRRAPWLIRGRSVDEVLSDNIWLMIFALEARVGVESNGFRTPGAHSPPNSRAEKIDNRCCWT